MGFREIHNWPVFVWKSKHYVCMCQIDSQKPFALSGHRYVTHAHYSNGNLARHWRASGGTSEETGETSHNVGSWWLQLENHRIRLTVEYIDPQETPPIPIDSTAIAHQSGLSKQSETLLDIIRLKL